MEKNVRSLELPEVRLVSGGYHPGVDGPSETGSPIGAAPQLPFPNSPYPPDMSYWTSVGWIFDNPGMALGYFADSAFATWANSFVAGMNFPTSPNHPDQVYNFDGCHYQCPW